MKPRKGKVGQSWKLALRGKKWEEAQRREAKASAGKKNTYHDGNLKEGGHKSSSSSSIRSHESF